MSISRISRLKFFGRRILLMMLAASFRTERRAKPLRKMLFCLSIFVECGRVRAYLARARVHASQKKCSPPLAESLTSDLVRACRSFRKSKITNIKKNKSIEPPPVECLTSDRVQAYPPPPPHSDGNSERLSRREGERFYKISCFELRPLGRIENENAASMCVNPQKVAVVGYRRNGKMILSFAPTAIMSAPYGTIDLPCGRCIGCETDRRNRWIARMEMESALYDGVGSFLTLTYRDAPPRLNKKHCQDFLKRFRQLSRHFDMPKFRYFLCGEYGSKGLRPHYHALLFGLDCFKVFDDSYIATVKDRFPVYSSPTLERCWSHGFVSVAPLTSATIRYVAKYVTKQSRKSDEFTLKSIGLGADFFFQFGDSRKDVAPGLYYADYPKRVLHFPSARGKLHAVAVPYRSFDRYAMWCDNALYHSLRDERRDFAISHVKDADALAARADVLSTFAAKYKQERILHE